MINNLGFISQRGEWSYLAGKRLPKLLMEFHYAQFNNQATHYGVLMFDFTNVIPDPSINIGNEGCKIVSLFNGLCRLRNNVCNRDFGEFYASIMAGQLAGALCFENNIPNIGNMLTWLFGPGDVHRQYYVQSTDPIAVAFPKPRKLRSNEILILKIESKLQNDGTWVPRGTEHHMLALERLNGKTIVYDPWRPSPGSPPGWWKLGNTWQNTLRVVPDSEIVKWDYITIDELILAGRDDITLTVPQTTQIKEYIRIVLMALRPVFKLIPTPLYEYIYHDPLVVTDIINSVALFIAARKKSPYFIISEISKDITQEIINRWPETSGMAEPSTINVTGCRIGKMPFTM